MSLLLYCVNGKVFATHDDTQKVPASVYGNNCTIVPWSGPLSSLTKGSDGLYLAPSITEKADLIAYAQAKRGLIAAGGISVNIAPKGQPAQNVEVSTDPSSLTMLHGAAMAAQANTSGMFDWVESTGASIALTSAQIAIMLGASVSFIQRGFTTLSAVISAINAGTITTQAQVDNPASPIPAWPVNS